MTRSSAFHLRSIRMLVVTVALVFASTFGFAASQVSADVLVPGASTGGAGGGGGSAQVDETERALALIALTSDTGFVAQTQNQQSIALSESELVQNAIVAAELAPQATNPSQPAY